MKEICGEGIRLFLEHLQTWETQYFLWDSFQIKIMMLNKYPISQLKKVWNMKVTFIFIVLGVCEMV